MLVVREVIKMKVTTPAEDVLALCKEWFQAMPFLPKARFMASVNEPATNFDIEWEVENLAQYEKVMADQVSHPKFPELWGRMSKLIESFRFEFYNVYE